MQVQVQAYLKIKFKLSSLSMSGLTQCQIQAEPNDKFSPNSNSRSGITACSTSSKGLLKTVAHAWLLSSAFLTEGILSSNALLCTMPFSTGTSTSQALTEAAPHHSAELHDDKDSSIGH